MDDKQKIKELENELSILRSFYKLVVKERDYERYLNSKLEDMLKQILDDIYKNDDVKKILLDATKNINNKYLKEEV